MISNLLWLLLIAIVVSFFWQQRRQSEMAKHYIQQRCQQIDVQLLSIARAEQSYGWPKKPLSIQTRYCFEFSVNGMDCYQGYALMKGLHLQSIFMPPYPI